MAEPNVQLTNSELAFRMAQYIQQNEGEAPRPSLDRKGFLALFQECREALRDKKTS